MHTGDTQNLLQDLQPENLWRNFLSLSSIPRCSKNEGEIIRFIQEHATSLGREFQKDAKENLVVRVPATPGYESHPAVALQAHVDMVCVKNMSVEHDFDRDPIAVYRKEDCLHARGTSLGADNGIGVAAMMALMEPLSLSHPPLELLFTVDEETGMNGAMFLSREMLRSRRLINLDTEDEGIIYVGCAGGADMNLHLPLEEPVLPTGFESLTLWLRGLKGGHSGMDIHLGRANAISLIARLLLELSAAGHPFYLKHLQGGEKRNAIPREIHAEILLEDSPKARKVLMDSFHAIQKEYEGKEDGMVLQLEEGVFSPAFSPETAERLMALLRNIPHGPLSMNAELADLVDTSSNLAQVRMREREVEILTNTRSSLDSAMESVREQIRHLAILAGARWEKGPAYPGWKPDLNSPLLHTAKEVFSEIFGREPELKAVHAGLETGIIGEKFPGMQMVSIGPEIRDPHSPDERVRISSVESFWRALVRLLEVL